MSVRIGHRGDHWIELGARHIVHGEALRFLDVSGALLFLREHITAGDLRTLRALLTRDNAMTPRLDDAALLRSVAHRLHAGALKAVVWHERRDTFVEQAPHWQPPRLVLPAAEPRVAAPAPVDEPPPHAPAPPPVMPRDWDAAAQAATLRAAARDGSPFCEVCRPPPPAAPPRPPAPPPASTLPPNSDGAAQARALREAARDGAPFCEICRKPAA
jgi:hypothetical protein